MSLKPCEILMNFTNNKKIKYLTDIPLTYWDGIIYSNWTNFWDKNNNNSKKTILTWEPSKPEPLPYKGRVLRHKRHRDGRQDRAESDNHVLDRPYGTKASQGWALLNWTISCKVLIYLIKWKKDVYFVFTLVYRIYVLFSNKLELWNLELLWYK